ncbi:hypothetical protein TNCV_702841 [Trichonephila clavipes]|nr:hypothetical protein TNCV_702841 [Trichonephila clavipes]
MLPDFGCHRKGVKSQEKFSKSLQDFGKENKLNRFWCSIDTNGRSTVKKSDSSHQSDVESSQGSSKPPSIRAPPPSPEILRASDSTSVFIPPPPSFVHTTPPGSGEPSPTMIPLQDLSMISAMASSLTQEEADEDEEEENA